MSESWHAETNLNGGYFLGFRRGFSSWRRMSSSSGLLNRLRVSRRHRPMLFISAMPLKWRMNSCLHSLVDLLSTAPVAPKVRQQECSAIACKHTQKKLHTHTNTQGCAAVLKYKIFSPVGLVYELSWNMNLIGCEWHSGFKIGMRIYWALQSVSISVHAAWLNCMKTEKLIWESRASKSAVQLKVPFLL